MAIDPVCGMQVDEKTAKHKSEYKGRDVLLLHAWLQVHI